MGNCTPISRIMATKILAIDICESLQSVYDLFQKYTIIDHIPVIEKGILKGMVYRTMLDSICPSTDKSTAVSQIMSRQFVYLSTENPIAAAVEIFRSNIFNLIPIVDKSKILVGILTPQDLNKTKKNDQFYLNNSKISTL